MGGQKCSMLLRRRYLYQVDADEPMDYDAIEVSSGTDIPDQYLGMLFACANI